MEVVVPAYKDVLTVPAQPLMDNLSAHVINTYEKLVRRAEVVGGKWVLSSHVSLNVHGYACPLQRSNPIHPLL